MTKSIHTDGYQELIGILVDARGACGLTQQQLADRLGKPQSFVAKYEGCERRLDIAEYIEVGRKLGVRVTVATEPERPRRKKSGIRTSP
jgi:ribosome-binding protein aMBF1 (putative translation factor)